MAYLHLSKSGEGRAVRTSAPAPIIQERIVEIPVMVEVVKEVIVDRPVEVVREVIVTNTVDIPVMQEVIKEVYIDRPYEVVKEVVKEVRVEVPTDAPTVYVDKFSYRTPMWAWVGIAVLVTTNILSLVLR